MYAVVRGTMRTHPIVRRLWSAAIRRVLRWEAGCAYWAHSSRCSSACWAAAPLLPALRFLKSRHFQSQVMLGNCRGLVFLTSMPYTFGQNPWIIEIEDPTTLFYPLIVNGRTLDLRIADSPYFPIVKTLLEDDSCKGILTHMKSTAEMVPTLFGSDIIAKKVFYAPLGVKLPPRWQRHDDRGDDEEIHLLFINSWCQVPSNFYVRGGLDVLEAFAILHERYPQLRLTLRTTLPPLDTHYHRIVESGWVRVIDRFLSAEEMADLHAESHIFLLPAARHPHRLAAPGDVVWTGRGRLGRLGHGGISRSRTQRFGGQGSLRQDLVGRPRGGDAA